MNLSHQGLQNDSRLKKGPQRLFRVRVNQSRGAPDSISVNPQAQLYEASTLHPSVFCAESSSSKFLAQAAYKRICSYMYAAFRGSNTGLHALMLSSSMKLLIFGGSLLGCSYYGVLNGRRGEGAHETLGILHGVVLTHQKHWTIKLPKPCEVNLMYPVPSSYKESGLQCW